MSAVQFSSNLEAIDLEAGRRYSHDDVEVHELNVPVSLDTVNVLPKDNHIIDMQRTSSIRNSFPVDMVFRDVKATYEKVDRKSKSKTTQHILNGVSAFIRPGSFTALMGPSGCGKTTLLNILAGKADVKWEGEILVNDKPRHKSFARRIGYVTQDDLMLERLTVREQLMFNARLRLSQFLSREEKARRVDDVIESMGLRACQDTRIGGVSGGRGVSGGERKRCAIACEMLINPSVLFLDEPTSGLDSYTALSVMEALSRTAKDHHRTVIASIHQPRSDIFSLFDNVILMSAGEIVYFGPGGDAMLRHFAALGYPCPPFTNPADFFIDLVTKDNAQRLISGRAGVVGSTTTDLLVMAYKKQASLENALSPSDPAVQSGDADATQVPSTPTHPQPRTASDSGSGETYGYAVGWWGQYVTLTRRAWLNNIRDPLATIARALQSVVLGVIIGTVFLRLGTNQEDVQNRLGSLFLMVMLLSFLPALSIITSFPAERPVFKKEARSGMYRTSSYYVGKLSAELPLWIVFPVLQGTIDYFMFGYQPKLDKYLIFIAAVVLSALVSISIAICVSCVVPNLEAANSALSPIFVMLLIFGGFFLNSESTPAYYLWIKYISQFYYSFEVLLVNEFNGLTFSCAGDACAYQTGQQVISAQGFDSGNIAQNLVIMAAFVVFYQLLAFFILQRQGRYRNK